MKLWELRPAAGYGDERKPMPDDPWEPWYDKSFGFVVRAETEQQAREYADTDAGDENGIYAGNRHPWLDASLSTCKELLQDGEPGVVLRDFASA